MHWCGKAQEIVRRLVRILHPEHDVPGRQPVRHRAVRDLLTCRRDMHSICAKGDRKINAQTKPAKHSAPGQYLGYALQPVRVFHHLLTSPKGAKVSLEFKDDVAIHHANGGLLLEQTKSALKQNPISDWAEDLWKAFENWRAMLVAEEIDPGATLYRLFVTPQKKGAFAEALSP